MDEIRRLDYQWFDGNEIIQRDCIYFSGRQDLLDFILKSFTRADFNKSITSQGLIYGIFQTYEEFVQYQRNIVLEMSDDTMAFAYDLIASITCELLPDDAEIGTSFTNHPIRVTSKDAMGQWRIAGFIFIGGKIVLIHEDK